VEQLPAVRGDWRTKWGVFGMRWEWIRASLSRDATQLTADSTDGGRMPTPGACDYPSHGSEGEQLLAADQAQAHGHPTLEGIGLSGNDGVHQMNELGGRHE